MLRLDELLKLSLLWYRTEDDKRERERMDVVRYNIEYIKPVLKREGKWAITDGNAVRIRAIVRTIPISYDNPVNPPKTHIYPVTFILEDLDLGFKSPVKLREGAIAKPEIPRKASRDSKGNIKRKGSKKSARERMARNNVKRGIQLQAFFETQYALAKVNALYGALYANRPPKVTNPKGIPFMGKHAWKVMREIVEPFIKNEIKKMG